MKPTRIVIRIRLAS